MSASARSVLATASLALALSACAAAPATNGGGVAASSTVTASSSANAVPTAAPLPPGRNGLIIYTDPAGDIHSLDPVTGRTKLVIGGPRTDVGPGMLPDNKHFVFVRVEEDMLYTANIDGTGVTTYANAKERSNWEISPDGRRIAQIHEGGGDVAIVDAAGGTPRALGLPMPVNSVSWVSNDSLVLVDEDGSGSAIAMWTVGVDGTGLTPIAAPGLCCGGTTFSSGGLIAWNTWDTVNDAVGRVHVMDAATRTDALLPSTDVPGEIFLDPYFSPDGRWISVTHVIAGKDGKQLALLAADGTGSARLLGPKLPRNDMVFHAVFSPDGTELLVTYDDGTSWLFDLATGQGSRTTWPAMLEATWQRLPPT